MQLEKIRLVILTSFDIMKNRRQTKTITIKSDEIASVPGLKNSDSNYFPPE